METYEKEIAPDLWEEVFNYTRFCVAKYIMFDINAKELEQVEFDSTLPEDIEKIEEIFSDAKHKILGKIQDIIISEMQDTLKVLS